MNKQLLIEALDNKKDVIFFFNSESCKACSEVKPLVEQFAKTKNKSFSYIILCVRDCVCVTPQMTF
jgi:thioredoxin-like negative regulator of GroEL